MTQRGAAVVGLTPAPRCPVRSVPLPPLAALCPCAAVVSWTWRVQESGGESTKLVQTTITDALFCDNGHDSVLHVQYP
jgi:hypothetical protein